MSSADAAPPGRLARFGRDVVDTLAVLGSPRAAYRRLRARRPLLAPWVLVALPSMALSLLVVSIAQRASVHLLGGMEDPELTRAVSQQLASMKLMSVLVAPLGVWLPWTATALLLWALATLLTRDTPFRNVLCVVACAGLPTVFARTIDLCVAWVDGPEVSPDLVPVATSASSLAALLPGAHGAWATALLDRLTPFAIWSGVLWTIGLQEMLGISGRRALAVVLPTWGAIAIGGAAVAVLRGSLAALAPGVVGS